MVRNGLYSKYVKRILDFSVSVMALIILSPLLLVTAILVRIKLGRPVIFKQARPGKDEKIFYLLKFRSMTNKIGEDGRLLPDVQRLTKFGNFIRSSSIDELLELINIIRGDMSIVGPRPLSIFYLPHYSPEFRRRHDIRPGLTGLAQVNGRNNLQWDERFSMDIEYIENVSFLLDIKIILKTIQKGLAHCDVAVRGSSQVIDYGLYSVLKEENKIMEKKDNMTYSEIGSYFWLDVNNNKQEITQHNQLSWLPAMEDNCFAFSGRNAIDIAIRDIVKSHDVEILYAPSYCCVSMLQEFIDRNIKIEFFDIGYKNGRFTYNIPPCNAHSVVLIMSYFGLDVNEAHKTIHEIKKTGAIVIEDITHSLLRDDAVSEYSDYAVVSLRKWFPIPTGGWVGKKMGLLLEKPMLDSNHTVREKIDAMREKHDYLEGKLNTKENFLRAQAKFENDLIHVDRMLKIDDMSLDILKSMNIKEIICQRRKNARILLNMLTDLNKIISIPNVDLSKDVPLFLPVIMRKNARNSLRKYLINMGIYCPIHWPEVMGAPVSIRENELSLICDQRYSQCDMHAIADAIYMWSKSEDDGKNEP